MHDLLDWWRDPSRVSVAKIVDSIERVHSIRVLQQKSRGSNYGSR